jgi:trimethylamine-N-oxide reductase cytochrome c-type subunit TorC
MCKLLKTLFFSLLLLGFFIQVSASEMYVFVSDTPLKAKDGKVAKLFLGVPVKVVKEKGENIEVALKGFLFGSKLYSTKSKKLLIATLDKGFKVTTKSENEVELRGLIEKGSLTTNSTEVWEEHEEFYFDMCSVCHAAPQVPHHSMTEWEALFEPMKGFAKLDKEEAKYLLRYIKSNAADGLIKVKH